MVTNNVVYNSDPGRRKFTKKNIIESQNCFVPRFKTTKVLVEDGL